MKIYINRQPVSGPWGGGNKTLAVLCNKILDNKFELVFDLVPDIDIIFCYDPRPNSKGIWYKHFIEYKEKYPDTKILQRVGDVGSHSKPELTNLLKDIDRLGKTDLYIFPSKWSMDYIDFKGKNYKIIENCPMEIFYKNRRSSKLTETIKIVTHHWSTNSKKGFKFYEGLTELLKSNSAVNKDIELTYIGRYNNEFKSEGWKLIPPTNEESLANLLPLYDIYLTASIEEAGANHVLEAMAAGLPVLYHNNGGSINEYCKNYGIGYSDNKSFITSLEKIIKDYKIFKQHVMTYDKNISESVNRYIECIKKYSKDRSE